MKNWYRDIGIILGVFIFGLCAGFLLRNQEIKILAKKAIIVQDSLNISQLLEKHKIKFSHIVLAQAKLESNNFKSDLFIKYNNFCGLRIAGQRYCFAINNYDYGAFAKYSTIEDCVKDIKSWQIQNALFLTTDDQYFELLEKVFCKDKDYVKRLKELIK
jgi:flagellum-specific peptidoglycan hydrolase FlgJ